MPSSSGTVGRGGAKPWNEAPHVNKGKGKFLAENLENVGKLKEMLWKCEGDI